MIYDENQFTILTLIKYSETRTQRVKEQCNIINISTYTKEIKFDLVKRNVMIIYVTF